MSMIPPSKQIREHYCKQKNEQEFDSEYSFASDIDESNNENKKKNRNDLIEINDLDITEINTNSRQKKSMSKLSTTKMNQKEKESVKSVKKLKAKFRSKSPILRNRGKNMFSDSSSDEEEIDEDSEYEIKNDESIDSSKRINERKINKIKDRKKNENIDEQIELESEESENESENESEKEIYEEYEENNNLKNRKQNCSFSKSPNKLRSKSIIKMSPRKYQLYKINNLLGKKRKIEIDESYSPRKKSEKSNNTNRKSCPYYLRSLSKNKTQKTRSVTPYKINNRKNRLSLELDQSDEEKSKEDINLNMSELDAINKLVKKYGLEKIINSLCKPKLNLKNELESYLSRLQGSYDNKNIIPAKNKTFFFF